MILAAITTCKRKPEMVERAVKSVIAQTYTDWNLVVVDDSPADYEFREDVRRMVEGYAAQDERIRYIPHDKNYGAQRARNTALKIADEEGFEYIAYLDDDDEWLPEKLEKQLARFEECGDDVGLVYCGFYIVNEKSGLTHKREAPLLKAGNLFDQVMVTDFGGSMFPLIRTRYLKEAGGFDEEMVATQDYETWVRLAKVCRFARVPEPLAKMYRYDGEHIWTNVSKPLRGHEQIINKYKSYLETHKDAYWMKLRSIAIEYRQNGEYGKFMKSWLKAISLRPLKVTHNLWTLFRAFLPFRFYEEGVQRLSIKHPRVHVVLSKCKRLLGGRK